jgi:hypothetical protein
MTAKSGEVLRFPHPIETATGSYIVGVIVDSGHAVPIEIKASLGEAQLLAAFIVH